MYRRRLIDRVYGSRFWVAVPVSWGYLIDLWTTMQGDGLESLEHSACRQLDVVNTVTCLECFTPEEVAALAGEPVDMVLLPSGPLYRHYTDADLDDNVINYYIQDTLRAWQRRGHRKHYRDRYWRRLSYER